MRNWIAAQYEANLFEGCSTRDEVASVIEDLEGLEFDKDELIAEAWSYIKDTLEVYCVETSMPATLFRTYKVVAANKEAAIRLATEYDIDGEVCVIDEFHTAGLSWKETVNIVKLWEDKE